MRGCVDQIRELNLMVQDRGIDKVIDGMGWRECHKLS